MPDPGDRKHRLALLASPGRRGAFFGTLLGALMVALTASADDPRRKWHTLETPHFWVHYHEPLGELAQRLAHRAERAHELLVPAFGYSPPGKTHVILRDETDSANGSARVIPYNLMDLFVVAPDSLSVLHDFDDWLFDLIVHEYAHILHLDTTHGWTRVYNAVFGKTFVWNAAQPAWFIEGIATYHESAQSSSGRVRSSLTDAYLRAATLEGRAPSIDQLSSERRAFPGGDAWYLWGSRFLDYVAQRYGRDKLRDISHEYAGALLPYGLNRTARHHTGKTYLTLYDEFQADLKRRYEKQAAEVRARGETPTRRLTFAGRTARYPRFTRDGSRILFFQSDGLSHAAIRSISPTGGEAVDVFETTTETPPSPGSSGDVVVERQEPWRTIYRFKDLFRYDRSERRLVRLTRGARAREPDVSPDGREIACSLISANSSGLAVVPISGGRPEVLIAPEGRRQVYTPAWSPDGRRIAYSGWTEGGFRDLFIYDLSTGKTRRLTKDRALDMAPRFAPDGKRLYFSSDRSGIYNIYALDLGSDRLSQVTNVITGAFQPDVSPDGKRLAFVGLSSLGFDVHVMDLDPARFLGAVPMAADRPDPPHIESTRVYASRPYQPFRDLYPRSLDVEWALMRSQPFLLRLGTSAVDPVAHHRVAVRTDFVPESERAIVRGAYTYTRLWPALGAVGQWGASRRGGFVLDGQNQVYREETTLAQAFAVLPVVRRAEHSVSVDVRYTAQFIHNTDEDRYEPDPNDVTPRFPETGTLAGTDVTLRYRGARGYAWSVSAEEGRNFRLGLSADREALGSDYRNTSLTFAWEEYLGNPWLDNQVLALNLEGGLSDGNSRRRRRFAIGGIPDRDIVQDLLQLTFIGGTGLRGYPPLVATGDRFLLLNAEYRFPLGELMRGVLSLPLYLATLHAAAFADWGSAFSGSPRVEDFRLGVGAELRQEIWLGYGQPLSLRLGYARGVDEGGVDDVFLIFGRSF